MRHQKKLKKLGLPKPHRTSLLRNLVLSLILNGKLRTTDSRAKALTARFARLMRFVRTKEKRELIRALPTFLPGYKDKADLGKKLDDLKIRFEKKTSGFTRITRVGLRKGDNASLVQIELI